jgi:hypothetical protein
LRPTLSARKLAGISASARPVVGTDSTLLAAAGSGQSLAQTSASAAACCTAWKRCRNHRQTWRAVARKGRTACRRAGGNGVLLCRAAACISVAAQEAESGGMMKPVAVIQDSSLVLDKTAVQYIFIQLLIL